MQQECLQILDSMYSINQEWFKEFGYLMDESRLRSEEEIFARLRDQIDSRGISPQDREKAILLMEGNACHPFVRPFLDVLKTKIEESRAHLQLAYQSTTTKDALLHLAKAIEIDRANVEASNLLQTVIENVVKDVHEDETLMPLIVSVAPKMSIYHFRELLSNLLFYQGRVDVVQYILDNTPNLDYWVKLRFLMEQSIVIANQRAQDDLPVIAKTDLDTLYNTWKTSSFENQRKVASFFWKDNPFLSYMSEKWIEDHDQAEYFTMFIAWYFTVAEYLEQNPDTIFPTSEMILAAQLLEKEWYAEFGDEQTPYFTDNFVDNRDIFEPDPDDPKMRAKQLVNMAKQNVENEKRVEYLVSALKLDRNNKDASYMLLHEIKKNTEWRRQYYSLLAEEELKELFEYEDDVDQLLAMYQSSSLRNKTVRKKKYMLEKQGLAFRLRGQGTFGRFYLGTNGHEQIARKISKHSIDQGYLFEIAFLDFCRYKREEARFIVQCKNINIESGMIDMEYQPTLENFYQDCKERICKEHIVPIAFQLLAGLAFMHKYRICHSDLKLTNVLYNPLSKELRLIDFGLIHVICDPTMMFQPSVETFFNSSSIIGNYYQMPPEALLCGENETCNYQKTCFNSSIDIWNVGLIMVDLLGYNNINYNLHAQSEHASKKAFGEVVSKLLENPFDLEAWNEGNFTCSQNPNVQHLTPQRNSIWAYLDREYNDSPDIQILIGLLKQCLAITPKDRIYARDALHHPIFRDVWPKYFSKEQFEDLTVAWSQDQFIASRLEQIPAPIFERKWLADVDIKRRTEIFEDLCRREEDAEICCRAIYLYDSHCYQQCISSPPMTSQKIVRTSSSSKITIYPNGYESVARLWLGYHPDINEVVVAAFINYITPKRLMGISFLDYAILHGIHHMPEIGTTAIQKTLQIMKRPDFVFHTYKENMRHFFE